MVSWPTHDLLGVGGWSSILLGFWLDLTNEGQAGEKRLGYTAISVFWNFSSSNGFFHGSTSCQECSLLHLQPSSGFRKSISSKDNFFKSEDKVNTNHVSLSKYIFSISTYQAKLCEDTETNFSKTCFDFRMLTIYWGKQM